MTAKVFLFPMVEYIGVFGCGFIMIFLDYFIRLHSLFLPLAIAVMRYIFVVRNQLLKKVKKMKFSLPACIKCYDF
jgi:hypothetical protein